MEVTLQRYNLKWLWVLVLAGLLIMLPYFQVLASEIGGYVSEQLIGRSGVASSQLVIGRSGVNNSALDVSMGAIVSTLPATNVSEASTILNGNLSDLNGFPGAIVYFEWGYGTGYGNTTAPQTLVGTGDFVATIGGYDSRETIHFRGVSETDGKLYGDDQTFEVGDRASSYHILRETLSILIAGVIFIAIIMKAQNPIVFLVMTIIGIMAWLIVRAILGI